MAPLPMMNCPSPSLACQYMMVFFARIIISMRKYPWSDKNCSGFLSWTHVKNIFVSDGALAILTIYVYALITYASYGKL
jgi:hypothetical protein